MKRKKSVINRIFLMAITLCILFSFVLTGCDNNKESSTASSGNNSTKEESVKLKLGFLESGYGREWIDYATQQFTAKYPHVTFDIMASPKIDDLISTRASAGNNEDMFDIFFGSSTEYINAGKAEPTTEIFNKVMEDSDGKKLNDVIVPGFNNPEAYLKGENWTFPITYYVGGMFFDQAFFKEKNWNMQPKTYDEFIALCDTIKKAEVDPIVVAGLYNYANFAFDTKIFELAIENKNNSFRNNFETFTGPQYTSPESKSVYQKLYDMGKNGYISKQSVGMNHTQSQMLVLQHKAAMCPSGDWIEGEMADSTPDGFEWGFMAVPFTNDKDIAIHISGGVSYNLMLWKDKPENNKKWSKEFLASLMSLDIQEKLAEKGANPMRTDYSKDATRADKLGVLQKSIAKYMAENNVVLELKQLKITLTDPDYVAALTHIGDNAQMVYTGQKTPDGMLEIAEGLIQGAIKRDKEAQGIK